MQEIENRELARIDKLDEKLFPRSKRTEIITYSGLSIDPVNPDIEKISIIDIAHALSNSCRYGGHCPLFYSVAEHSLRVVNLMREAEHSPLEQFAGLMHDAEEAYLMDMPTPIKRQFQSYVDAGDKLRMMIFDRFKIPYELYQSTRHYDQRAYELERSELWSGAPTLRPMDAKERFLETWKSFAVPLRLGLLPSSKPTALNTATRI